MNRIRSETTQAKQKKALGKTNYRWVLACNTSSVSKGCCDWLVNHLECIDHREKDCLLPKSVTLSWLLGVMPIWLFLPSLQLWDFFFFPSHLCSSHLCAGPGGALSITVFFVLYSTSRQNSQYWLQVPTSSLLKNSGPVVMCLSPCSSWMPPACSPSVRAGCFFKWLGFVGFCFGVFCTKGKVKLEDYKGTKKMCLHLSPFRPAWNLWPSHLVIKVCTSVADRNKTLSDNIPKPGDFELYIACPQT